MTRISLPIPNRKVAGRALGKELNRQFAGDDHDVLVLALPRGGVPVGYEIAQALDAPLDILLVRKLGVPGHKELAAGAIASGGVKVLNRSVIASMSISDHALDQILRGESQELERRERTYRGSRIRPVIEGRTVILVDDGVATGATMRAAIAALRKQSPRRIVVAVPVAPDDTISVLRNEADDVICLAAPSPFFSIGTWYQDFHQVSDEEVIAQLDVGSAEI